MLEYLTSEGINSALPFPRRAMGKENAPKRRPRVILAFDLDCFYASVVIRGNPSLAHLPVGVVQKHLVVTCNYVARGLGVRSMSRVADALAVCPQLTLVDGSDLSPFRRTAAEVRATVRGHLPQTTPLQWLGLDEIFVDATAVVTTAAATRAPRSDRPPPFRGHLCGDLRDADDIDALARGAELAHEVRALVKRKHGVTMHAGIGASKLASKIAAGLHKPDDQTTFLDSGAVASHLASLPPTAIPGFGQRYWSKLSAAYPKLETTQHVLEHFPRGSERLLAQAMECNEKVAAWALGACAGEDDEPVIPSAPPKLVSNQDAMRNVSSRADVLSAIRALGRHVLTRLADGADEFGPRQPSTLVVTFRLSGTGYKPTQRAMPMPASASSPFLRNGHARFEKALEAALDQIVQKVLDTLGDTLRTPPFAFTLLGIGATNFRTGNSLSPAPASAPVLGNGPQRRGIANFLVPKAGKSGNDSISTGTASFDSPSSEKHEPDTLTCPICSACLPSSTTNERLNAHVDRCVAGAGTSPSAAVPGSRKRSRPSAGAARRIDDFFQTKKRPNSRATRED